MTSSRNQLILALLLIMAVPAFAQCSSSPENPTLILAGLATGAYGVSQLRTRLSARRAAKPRS